MSLKVLIYLIIGTAVMLIPILIQGRWYGIGPRKCIPFALGLTVTGTAGAYLMYFIESGGFGAISFYGSVFLIPVVFFAAAKLLRLSYGRLMDLSAPAVCAMLAVMKVQCLFHGCCGGRELGGGFVFPSQIAELVNALIIMVVLLALSRGGKFRGKLYPWYMVIYGVTRFVLNLLRANTAPFALGLPAGNFWSLVAIAAGAAWLILPGLRSKKAADA